MYLPFYGLEEQPFNLTPDSKFLFLSHRHQEALAALLFGVQERKGFICLSGEIGSGKTTLIRALLGQLDPQQVKIAVILNSYLDDLELLKAINEEFGLPADSDSKKALLDELNRFLVERHALGHNVVLILDEAQNLKPQTLEQIRMISNLETETEKLIQILLVGQPEMRRTLALPELEQLNQRITVRYHVKALDENEVANYVRHRLTVARAKVMIDFTPQAVRLIYHYSKGVPRRINVICDRCLLVGYVLGRYDIDGDMVQRAVDEVRGESGAEPETETSAPTPSKRWPSLMARMALGAALVSVALGGVWLGSFLKAVTDRNADAFDGPTLAGEAHARTNAPAEPPAPEWVVDSVPSQAVTALSPAAAQFQPPAPSEMEIDTLQGPDAEPAPARPPSSTEADGAIRDLETLFELAAAEGFDFEPPPSPTPEPTATPFPYPAWEFDRDRIVRVHRADHVTAAAYLTLLGAWGIDLDLGEFAAAPPDQIARFDLPATVRQLDFHAFLTIELTEALKLDLPMLARIRPGTRGFSPAVAVVRLQGELLVIADPIRGLRTLPRSWIESAILNLTVLYRDPWELSRLRPGAEGESVERLQQFLIEEGIEAGDIDGRFGPQLADGLRAFQKQHKLPASGRMNPMTAAMISAMLEPLRPRLYS